MNSNVLMNKDENIKSLVAFVGSDHTGTGGGKGPHASAQACLRTPQPSELSGIFIIFHKQCFYFIFHLDFI